MLEFKIIEPCLFQLKRADSTGAVLPLTEGQPKTTTFMLSFFVGESETGGLTIQNLNRQPQFDLPCCIIAFSAFAISMVPTLDSVYDFYNAE